jgi:PAS domain S-box-containing protein
MLDAIGMPAAIAEDASDFEIAALAKILEDTQRRLRELTHDEVDAILSPSGQSYLLLGAQEKLREDQAALRVSEECFRETFEQAAVGIAHVSIEGRFLRMNDKFCDIVGIGRAERRSMGFVEQSMSEDLASGAEARRAMLAGEISAHTTERRYRSKSGDVVWAQVVSVLERTGTGEPKYFTSVFQDITARKLAEEDRNRSQVMLGIAGKLGHLGGWSVELPGMQVIFSEEVCVIHGISPGSTPTVDVAISYYAPEFRGTFSSAFWATVRDGTPFDLELQIITAGGKRVWVRTIGVAERNAAGEVVRVHGAFQDISDRKRAEMTAIRLATLVEFSDDAIIGKDLDGIISSWNKGAERIFGFTAAEMEGTSIMRLLPPDRIEEENQMLARIKLGGSTERFETKRLTREGRLIDVAMTVSPIKDPAGTVIGLATVARDITERKLIEESLRESEERFRGMFAAAATGITIATPEGRFLEANTAYCEMLGYTEDELRARDFASITHPEDLPLNVKLRNEFLAGKTGSFAMEKRYLKKNGDVVWGRTSVTAVRVEGNKIATLIGVSQDITKAKKAQESLVLFRTLIDQLNDAIEVIEPGTLRIIDANEGACRSLGYGREELLSMSVPDIDPNIDPALDERILKELGTVGRITFESRQRRKDGTTFPVEVNLKRVQLEKSYIVSVVRDITERKRSESRFRRLIDSNVQSVIFWNTKGEITDANEAFLNLVRYSREDLDAGRIGWAAMTPPEYGHLDRDALAQIAATGICATYEKEWIRKDGSRVPILIGAANFEDKPDHGVSFALDLTEKVKSEEALRSSEKRFKALFDQAAVGVAQIDAATGRYLHANKRFVEILDLGEEELIKPAKDIIHLETVGSTPDLVRQVNAGARREFNVEKRYLRKDGSEIWANVTVSEMWASGDRPDYYMAIVQDITTRKKLEEQFRQAQKMEAMGTLAGGIAHDFNNILGSIIGYTELAQLKLRANPQVGDYLDSVLRASRRAASLVRQILSFSRQEKLDRAPIPLQPVLIETIQLLRASIPSTVEFVTSLATDAPTVLADANQIHQIVMNLGTNALHATKDLGGRIEFRLERCVVDDAHAATQPRLRPGVYARVSIVDNGCGMDKATIQRIFEPFFTTKPPGEGTGLGLSVVHGIMESHDGAITVHSQPGEGTVFHLYFPMHAGEAAMDASDLGPVPRGRGEEILFVDDEELLVRLGRESLVALGYVVESVAQPEDALAMVRENPSRFALVLTDQAMPGMTGLVLAKKLQEIRPGMPIVLMTGYGGSLSHEQFAAAGVRKLLLKPINLQSLGAAVREVISGE